MNAIDLIIICFATVRLTNLFMYDSGPYDIFEKLRQWAGIIDGSLYLDGKYSLIGNILICHYCTSIYMAIFAATMFYFDLQIVNVAFAASQLAIIIINYIEEH